MTLRYGTNSDKYTSYLELAHDRGDLIFKTLICHFPTSEIYLVPNENDRDLRESFSCTAMIADLSQLTLMPSRRNRGSQYSATLSKLVGSDMEYTRQMT